jgi:hypothetical protein
MRARVYRVGEVMSRAQGGGVVPAKEKSEGALPCRFLLDEGGEVRYIYLINPARSTTLKG